MATHESSASSLATLPGYQFWKVRGSPLAQRDQNGLLGELDFLQRPTQVTEVSFLVMLWMLLGLTVTRSLKQAWQGVKGFQLVGHKPERGKKKIQLLYLAVFSGLIPGEVHGLQEVLLFCRAAGQHQSWAGAQIQEKQISWHTFKEKYLDQESWVNLY